MATSSDINVGTFIRHNGELVKIEEYIHRTPGNLRAFYQAVMRNVKTGRKVEYRFRAGESVETVRVEERKFQFIYPEGDSVVLMDNDSFEQIYVQSIIFGDQFKFMKEGMEVAVRFDGDEPVDASIPKTVEVEITYTEPGLSGDTATKTLKPATTDTGAEIRVPLFVNIGDKVKVDTSNGEYMERVK
jgi:elongation factor P